MALRLIAVVCLGFLVGFAAPSSAATINFSVFSTNYNENTFWGFAADPVTGNYYARFGYGDQGQSMRRYTSLAAFAADTPAATVTIGSGGHWGTYFAVNNNDMFGRSSSPFTNEGRRWDTLTGNAETGAVAFSGMGGGNGSHTYDWGGYSGVNFMQDQTGIYVFGRNQTGNDWTLREVDAGLNTTNSVTYTPDDPQLGYGFMINGYLFTGPGFTTTNVTRQVNASTGAVTNVSHTLTGFGSCCYLSNFAYDSGTDRLFAWNTHDARLYVATNASQQFGVEAAPVPEPATLMLVGSGVAWAVRRRRRGQRPPQG